jgi:hypothetical protein
MNEIIDFLLTFTGSIFKPYDNHTPTPKIILNKNPRLCYLAGVGRFTIALSDCNGV